MIEWQSQIEFYGKYRIDFKAATEKNILFETHIVGVRVGLGAEEGEEVRLNVS